MKIVFLSPVHPLLTPGNPLPRWQMQSSWVQALEQLGHEVAVIKYTPDDRIRLGIVSRLAFNFRVIKRINKTEEVNLIIYSLGADVLFQPVVYYIKLITMAPLAILSGVSPIVSGNSRERRMAKLADLVATNDNSHCKQWMKLGAKRAVELPIAAIDPQLHYKRRVKRDLDVVFVGTLTKQRRRFLNRLERSLGKEVKMVVKQFVWEEDYAELISRAKIVVNPLRPEMKNGVNLRVFETAAFGALQLTNSGNKNWLEPDREMLIYRNTKEAVELIRHYLTENGERRKIVLRAWKRTMAQHTFKHRAEELIKLTEVRMG